LNQGRYFTTGSSRPSFPSSRSCIIAMAVNSLLCEAHTKLRSRRHWQLRLDVREAETPGPDQFLVTHHADSNTRDPPIGDLPFDPRGEEALGPKNLRIVGNICAVVLLTGTLRLKGTRWESRRNEREHGNAEDDSDHMRASGSHCLSCTNHSF